MRKAPWGEVGEKTDGLGKERDIRLDREWTLGHPSRFNSVHTKSFPDGKFGSQDGLSVGIHALSPQVLAGTA